MNSKLTLSAAIAGSCVIAAPVMAEQDSSTDQVVVTATRIAQTIDQTLVPVSVLTREDIERSPASSLPELLGQLPGVDFSISGGAGKTASLFMRGTSSSHTLVLIDGVRIGSATLGSVPFENLPLSQIERVELVRGPRSSLYGSEAIGGVIQIFTRDATGSTGPRFAIGTGDQGTRQGSAGFSFNQDQHALAVNLSRFETDGYDVQPTLDPDDDGYENNSLSVNLQSEWSERIDTQLTLLHIDAENHYDRSPAPADDYSDKLQQTLGARVNAELSENWGLSLGLSQHKDESEAFDNTPGEFNTQRRLGDIKLDHYLSDSQILTLGAEYQQDEVDSTQNYLADERDNKALFGQWQAESGSFSLLAGIRVDDNEAFGSETTGNINLGYQFDTERRLLASYGTAFKAPTFNDLYWPADLFASGNPNLDPESSKSVELGYEFNSAEYHYAARMFMTEVDDLIEWACTANCLEDYMAPPYPFWQPSNVSSAKIKGLELEGGFAIGQWQGNANLTWLDPRNEDTDKLLTNRTRRSVNLALSRGFQSWLLTANLRAQSERYTDAFNSNRLAGYGVTDLKARYQLDDDWALEAKVNNLFDKAYATNSATIAPDRTYLLSLSYNH